MPTYIVPPPFFTDLTQPADTVSQSTPASPFDAATAYLLGQCCNFAYDQFAQGAAWAPDWSSLIVAGYTVSLATTSLTNPQPLTMTEAIGPSPTLGDAGYYVQLPAGFAVQLTLTPTGGGDAQTIVVIALRGTRTWQEWINDLEALPATFTTGSGINLGTVHAGFFADYTVGTAGATSSSPLSTTGDRAAGSLAAAIASYVSQLDDTLPLYVTGHSLGGGLAALCALDVAVDYPDAFSSLAMYSLGSPRVAVGAEYKDISIDDAATFVQNYQLNVPATYAIVHAADIVPILPPLTVSLPPTSPLFTLAAAQVTDPWGGTGATAAAQLDSAGGVTSIDVTSSGSGYQTDYPPTVVISGGGGSGAAATAAVDSSGDITITVTAAGSGYTTPPTLQIASPSLLANVISFCAQTGDILDNHMCTITYVPYLAQLAAGFSAS